MVNDFFHRVRVNLGVLLSHKTDLNTPWARHVQAGTKREKRGSNLQENPQVFLIVPWPSGPHKALQANNSNLLYWLTSLLIMAMFCICFLKMWKRWLILVRQWVTGTLSVQLYVSHYKCVRVFHQPTLCAAMRPHSCCLAQLHPARPQQHIWRGIFEKKLPFWKVFLPQFMGKHQPPAHEQLLSFWPHSPGKRLPGMWIVLPTPIPLTFQTHHNHLGWGGQGTKVLKCWIPKLLFLWQHGALNRNEVCLSHLFSPLGIKASYKNLLRRRHPCCRCLKMVRQIQF